jgi:hypothetical protein
MPTRQAHREPTWWRRSVALSLAAPSIENGFAS